MFLSINKKFFLTIIIFFLIISVCFTVIFDGIIGKKIRSEHTNIITRNQYVIELLNENINLRRKLLEIQPTDSAAQQFLKTLNQKQSEISKERQLNEELNQNYNETYASLSESFRIISTSAVLTLLSLVILWFLLQRWVITPINKLTDLSISIANGDFSQRLKIEKNQTTDEFDTLMTTINFMLDNIENNIKEIKRNETFLQNLVDALPDAVRLIDDEHNIILSNKAYNDYISKHYLYRASKCYAAYAKGAKIPCNTNQYVCPLKELQQQKNNSTIKLIHNIKNHPISINSARININGKTGIVESFRDLRENIHYSHQQKISSLGFLATSLAHEMKNNLGAINIIINGILQKYHKDTDEYSEETKYMQMISEQIIECIKVPERLLKLARNASDTVIQFNAIDSIKDIISLFDYEIKSKGITVQTKFALPKEIITGNETDFKMIILNLIQNALNAMPNGGLLEIKTETKRNKFLIKIKDTGCGMTKEEQAHIFEPFFSVSKSDKKQGNGLGLAIVKDLLSKYRAQIEVESQKDIGSSFTITFPAQKNTATSTKLQKLNKRKTTDK